MPGVSEVFKVGDMVHVESENAQGRVTRVNVMGAKGIAVRFGEANGRSKVFFQLDGITKVQT